MENIKTQVQSTLDDCKNHLNNELLPFWINRIMDKDNGGFITHFDEHGHDAGEVFTFFHLHTEMGMAAKKQRNSPNLGLIFYWIKCGILFMGGFTG